MPDTSFGVNTGLGTASLAHIPDRHLAFQPHPLATRMCLGKRRQGQQGLKQDRVTWDLLRGQLSAEPPGHREPKKPEHPEHHYALPCILPAQCALWELALGSPSPCRGIPCQRPHEGTPHPPAKAALPFPSRQLLIPCWGAPLVHGITELFRLERPSKTIESNIPPALPMPPLNHVPKCHICIFSEHFQGWSLHCCPGQPV